MSERVLISWNVPNLITIPLMAFAGFLLLSIIYQMVLRSGVVGRPAAKGGEA
jgi:hypothetical protein